MKVFYRLGAGLSLGPSGLSIPVPLDGNHEGQLVFCRRDEVWSGFGLRIIMCFSAFCVYRDHYDVLGVDKDVDAKELKKKYFQVKLLLF